MMHAPAVLHLQLVLHSSESAKSGIQRSSACACKGPNLQDMWNHMNACIFCLWKEA